MDNELLMLFFGEDNELHHLLIMEAGGEELNRRPMEGWPPNTYRIHSRLRTLGGVQMTSANVEGAISRGLDEQWRMIDFFQHATGVVAIFDVISIFARSRFRAPACASAAEDGIYGKGLI